MLYLLTGVYASCGVSVFAGWCFSPVMSGIVSYRITHTLLRRSWSSFGMFVAVVVLVKGSTLKRVTC